MSVLEEITIIVLHFGCKS